MPQVPLTDDLNVIASSDFDITLFNGDLNIIQKLDDEPNDVGGLTAAELKAKFDESGLTIQKYINQTLIPELLAEQAVEAARISNEQTRIANESARIAAEQSRVNTNTGIVAQATAQANEAKKQADRAEAAASGGNHASRHAKTGPDPITPAAIGASPADFQVRKELNTSGWYNIGQIRASEVVGAGAIRLTIAGNYSSNLPRIYTLNIGFSYFAVTCEKLFGTGTIDNPGYVTKVRAYRSSPDTYTVDLYYSANTKNAVTCTVQTLLGQFEGGQLAVNSDNLPAGLTASNLVVKDLSEWVHPPKRTDGKEYRTTERYMGKPVYATTVNVGGFPESGNIWVPWNKDNARNVDFIVRTHGNVAKIYELPLKIDSSVLEYSCNQTSVQLRTVGTRYTHDNAIITFYYTKTTDTAE